METNYTFQSGKEHIKIKDEFYQICFFLSGFVLIYVYIGYPILISFFSIVIPFKRKKKSGEISHFELPSVSLLIPAYNEEKVIEKKIINLLSLDYPKDKIEIVVASDGSTDKTNEIVRKFNDKIRLIPYDIREGKTILIIKQFLS